VFLTVTDVQGCTNYDVIITNVCSPGTPTIRSSSVAVCALADDDHDGLADVWELRYFGTTNVPPQTTRTATASRRSKSTTPTPTPPTS